MTSASEYLKMCQGGWTGRVHPNGSPCTAKPGNCPFENRAEKADSFSSPENDKIGTKNETEKHKHEVHKRVSEETLRGLFEGTGILGRAADVARGIRAAGDAPSGGGKSEHANTTAAKQEDALRALAKENGIWHENADLDFDKTYGEGVSGSETIAYLNEETQEVQKVISDNFYATPLDNLVRIALHNRYFPETALTLRGFGTIGSTWLGSRFALIATQPLVSIDRAASESEIRNHMKGLGFHEKDWDLWMNEDESVTVSDLHEENAVVDFKGNVVILDADIRFNN